MAKRVNDDLLTTRETASLLGVGTTSIKRWADDGLLDHVKTAGGHRRFSRTAVAEFLHKRTPGGDVGDPLIDSWIRILTQETDIEGVDKGLRELYDDKGSWWQSTPQVGQVIEEIGMRWQTGRLDILQEHLASARLARGLARAADQFPQSPNARSALLVAAPEDDHTLGLSIVELILREAGWITRWAGRATPLSHITTFVESGSVNAVIVSASSYSIDDASLRDFASRLGATCRNHDVDLLLGGSGRWPPNPTYGTRLHSFAELHEFAQDKSCAKTASE